MHTRQSSLYFCMVKIKNFKHIYVQKNIKVVKFIENLHGQEVIRTWGVKENLVHMLCENFKEKNQKFHS